MTGNLQQVMDILDIRMSRPSTATEGDTLPPNEPTNCTISVNTSVSSTGALPLHIAASKGHIDIVMLLIDKAGAIVDLADTEQETALLKASYHGNADIVAFLLERSANPGHQDKEGWSALHNCAARGHVKAASLLIEAGADVNITNATGHTPLMTASSNGHVEMVDLLLQSWANPILTNNYNDTAYDLAAQAEESYICELLEHAEYLLRNRKSSSSSVNGSLKSPSSTPALPGALPLEKHTHNSHIELIYEHQRATLFSNRNFSALNLSSADRQSFGIFLDKRLNAPVDSLDSIVLPTGWYWVTEWHVDLKHPKVDPVEGWQYAKAFDELDENWKTEPVGGGTFTGSWVRRRRWIRVRKMRTEVGSSAVEKPRLSVAASSATAADYLERSQEPLSGLKLTVEMASSVTEKLREERKRYEDSIRILLAGLKADSNEARKKTATDLLLSYMAHAEKISDKLEQAEKWHTVEHDERDLIKTEHPKQPPLPEPNVGTSATIALTEHSQQSESDADNWKQAVLESSGFEMVDGVLRISPDEDNHSKPYDDYGHTDMTSDVDPTSPGGLTEPVHDDDSIGQPRAPPSDVLLENTLTVSNGDTLHTSSVSESRPTIEARLNVITPSKSKPAVPTPTAITIERSGTPTQNDPEPQTLESPYTTSPPVSIPPRVSSVSSTTSTSLPTNYHRNLNVPTRTSSVLSTSNPSHPVTVRAPPSKWQPDSTALSCTQCTKRFTLFIRRHHCRWCGKIFCDSCTAHRVPLSSIYTASGMESEGHRICDGCYSYLTGPETPLDHLRAPSPTERPSSSPANPIDEVAELLSTLPSAFSNWASSIANATSQAFQSMGSISPSEPSPLHQRLNQDRRRQQDFHFEDEDDDDEHEDDEGNHEGRSMSDSIMNECPVCQTSLDAFNDVETRETHVADCLRKVSVGRGVGMTISGNRYIAQTLKEELDGVECVICFNEFEAGQRVARLNCLCIYHESCIESWFQRSAHCPVHYK
ncbi:hypothetical protein HDV05_005506 [Chytridiales sp. JEL 0842]|nr:hypothetical protein HDV05_005506 [Chytridiales sp. JEL 0842]